MPEPILIITISGVLGLITGGISGYFSARQKLKSEIAEDIRNSRKQSYKELWKLSGKMPKYPASKDVGIQKLGDLYDLSVSMADWYFNSDGGIIMTTDTQKQYKKVQEDIETTLLKAQNDAIKEMQDEDLYDMDPNLIQRRFIADLPLRRNDYTTIRNGFSTLRSSMTDDLLSRKRLFFKKNINI